MSTRGTVPDFSTAPPAGYVQATKFKFKFKFGSVVFLHREPNSLDMMELPEPLRWTNHNPPPRSHAMSRLLVPVACYVQHAGTAARIPASTDWRELNFLLACQWTSLSHPPVWRTVSKNLAHDLLPFILSSPLGASVVRVLRPNTGNSHLPSLCP